MERKGFPKFVADSKVIVQPNSCFVYSKLLRLFDVFNFESVIHFERMTGTASFENILDELKDEYESVDYNILRCDFEKIVTYLEKRGYVQVYECKQKEEFPIEFSDKSEKAKAVHAEIELTKNCNLSCVYCYAESKNNAPDLPATKWIKILDRMFNAGLRAVKITGGEPFLHRDFKEVVEYCSNKFIVTINTNGHFIDNHIARWLASLKLQNVQISLDSISSEVHDKYRGVRSWQKAISGIQNLKESGVTVRLSCTTHNENLGMAEKIKEFSKQHDIEVIFQVMQPVGNAERLSDKVFIGNACEITQHNVYSIYKMLDYMEIKCQAQIGFVGITSDGFLKPCNLNERFFSELKADVLGSINYKFSYDQTNTFINIDRRCKELSIIRRNDKHGFARCIFHDDINVV